MVKSQNTTKMVCCNLAGMNAALYICRSPTYYYAAFFADEHSY
jgi:hypothetical protein